MSHATYAGIGNRVLPEETRFELRMIAYSMSRLGWSLRTGGAEGADRAFMDGHGAARVEVFGPEDATDAAMAMAATYHPAWWACDDHARRLLGRNAQIILGRNLDDPVAAVLAYAADKTRGGTALGMRIARAHGIPAVNLAARWS